jgi:hypothetical protein
VLCCLRNPGRPFQAGEMPPAELVSLLAIKIKVLPFNFCDLPKQIGRATLTPCSAFWFYTLRGVARNNLANWPAADFKDIEINVFLTLEAHDGAAEVYGRAQA